MTPTSRRLVAVLLALSVVCSACTSEPSEPDDPVAGGTPPAVQFTAVIAQRGDQALHITYDLVNASDGNLIVFNRVPGSTTKDDPAAVYVTGAKPAGRVQIAKRAFQQPENDKTKLATTPLIGVVRLEPGRSVHEEFDVPLPLQRRHPYGDDYGDGSVNLPNPIRDVVFCVGAARESELPPVPSAPAAVGTGLILAHVPEVTKAQHLSCSDPLSM